MDKWNNSYCKLNQHHSVLGYRHIVRSIFFTFIMVSYFCMIAIYSSAQEKLSFHCETQAVLSLDKNGKLTQFLPGKIYFDIKNEILIFGKIGYLTDESIPITFVSKNKFYAFDSTQSILFEEGLFHHVISTFEGLTAVQAKCSINNM